MFKKLFYNLFWILTFQISCLFFAFANEGCDIFLNKSQTASTSSQDVFNKKNMILELIQLADLMTADLSIHEIVYDLETVLSGVNNNSFSPHINDLLKNARQVYQTVYEKIELIYQSEIAEFESVLPKDFFSGKIFTPANFDLKTYMDREKAYIQIAKNRKSNEVKYLNEATRTSNFVLLGLVREENVDMSHFRTSEDFSRLFKFRAPDMRFDENRVRWIYRSFLLESYIHNILNDFSNLKFPIVTSNINKKYTLLLSAYPELFYFWDRMEMFGFDAVVDLSHSNGIMSPYMKVRDKDLNYLIRMKVNPYLVKDDPPINERVEIQVTLPNPRNLNKALLTAENIIDMKNWIYQKWSRFSNENQIYDYTLLMSVDKSETYMTVTLETGLNDNVQDMELEKIRLLGEFFLTLSSGVKSHRSGLSVVKNADLRR